MLVKKSFSLLLVLAFFQIASAQNCESSYYTKSGAKFETTEYDPNGVVKSVTNNSVTDVQDGNASIKSVKSDAEGKVTEEKTLHYNCTESGVFYGMGANDSKTKKEAVLEYPSNMSAGMALKGNVSFEYSKKENGKTGRLVIKITDRKVTGKERITVKAGTWDCTKITYKERISFGIGIIMFPINFEIVEYFNPEVGVVKSELYAKGTKYGYSDLTSVSK